MARRGFQLNRTGMNKLAQGLGTQRATVAAANRAMDWAVANAPVRSGDYKDSFEVDEVEVTVSGQKRAGARLINTSDHAWGVEWGKGATHVLQRSIDHAKE